MKVAAFDLDGTLIPTNFEIIYRILAILGLSTERVTTDFLRSHWGSPYAELAQLICKEAGDESKLVDFLLTESRIQIKPKISAEILEVLQELKNLGIYLALITSRNRAGLNSLELDLSVFDLVQTIDDHSYRKPDGQVFGPLVDIVSHRGIKPNEIIYFGDTVNHDFGAVKSFSRGLRFVGVSSGVSGPAEFRQAGIFDFIEGIENLPGKLREIFLTPLLKTGS